MKKSKKSAKALKKMAYSGDPFKRKEAAIYLGEQHFNEEYLGLIKRLIKDEDEGVWRGACVSLGKFAFGNSNVYKYIKGLVNDDYFWVQKRGIHALGEFGKYDHRGIRYLTEIIGSGRKEIIEEVVDVLGNIAIESEDAFKMLIKLIRSKDELIIQPAISSVGILARERDEALKELKPFLKDNNNLIRLWAASAIGDAAGTNDSAFEIFSELVDDKDVYLRRGFSKGLLGVAKNRPDETLIIIERTVEDDDRYVRTNAARALGEITTKNRKAFTLIQTLLNHDKGDVRRGAAEALLNIPDEIQKDVIPLIKTLVKDDDYYLRSVAAFASANMADTSSKDAIKLLRKLVKDKDEYVRRDVALALGELPANMAGKAFPYLKKLLEDRESIVRRVATKSLKVAAGEKRDEILTLMPMLMDDFDESVRVNTAEVLWEIAEPRIKKSFACLKNMASDESPRVRDRVAKGLEIVFDLEPDLFFTRIMVLQDEGIDPEVLELVSKLARDEEIARVCELFAALMSGLNEANIENYLKRGLEVLEDIKNLKYSDDFRNVFKTFLLGIRARRLEDIALIKFDPEPLKSLHKSITGIDPEIFGVLEELPEIALRYKQIEGLSDKHLYLGKMLGLIDSTLENLQEAKYPETKIMKQVLINWRVLLSQTMEGLKGRADLRVVLRTKKLLPLETLTLLLGIENTGESLAEHLVVQLMPSPSYKIIDKTKRIEMLARERNEAVEFRIKTRKKKGFRVKFNISFDDLEMKGKTLSFADRVSFIDIPREFKYIPNPYITGGPIKPGSREMFFGRSDVFDFVKNNLSSTTQKNVLILQGERRTGKTSILYQLSNVLGPEYICVFLDGQEFGRATLDYLFYRMAKLISNACEKEGIGVSLPPKKAFKDDPWYVFKDQFLEKLNDALGNKYLVIFFDEFESLEHAVTSGALDPVIFDYIRNLMQHEEKLVFLFSGVHRLEEMMQDYWGVMFNIALYWKISFLGESEARKLIIKPVEGYNMLYDDLAIEKIIRATACHPYFVQLLCRFLVNRHNTEKRNYITVQDVKEELVNVVEKARPHFDYIWALSSSYERMLLAILPEILRKKNIATVTDILEECDQRRLDVSKGKIILALKTLTAKDIFVRISNGAVHYRFKVDFIRMWVEKHQPLSKVVEEMGEELRVE